MAAPDASIPSSQRACLLEEIFGVDLRSLALYRIAVAAALLNDCLDRAGSRASSGGPSFGGNALPAASETSTLRSMTEILRTPDERFSDLPDYHFDPTWVEVTNPFGGALRMHAVDVGPRDAPVVLLCHGEPTWSFLYRKMIPVFVEAGLRAVAPDYIGFGKSDKLGERTAYSFEQHIAWIRELVQRLDLRDVTFFGQDWGGPIGLGVLAAEEERFARAVVGNTMLHSLEAELAGRVAWSNHSVGESDSQHADMLLAWIATSQRLPDFEASLAVRGSTARGASDEVLAAYDAPFPDERYKAGMRQFPALIPLTRLDPGAAINRATWKALGGFEKPFLTLFGDSDPGTAGWDAIFQERVPGAKGQPHAVLERAGHFLQEDCAEELARRIVEFAGASG